MSLESSEYTVYEEDEFVEVCVEHVNGTIRRTIPVTLSTSAITAGIRAHPHFCFCFNEYFNAFVYVCICCIYLIVTFIRR